jgi:hypothetical protein
MTKEKIEASFLSADYSQAGIKKMSGIMDGLRRHTLKFTPWKGFAYRPQVSFSICYSNDHLFLKYFVKEKEIRAHANRHQGPVWEDACVEFFLSFENDNGGYYNFEFNCLGTFLAAFGPSKTERKALEQEVIKQIKTLSCIVQHEQEEIEWELTAAIPIKCLVHSSVGKLQGISCNANFYKCGDMLNDPHFVAWSDISCETPNFHLPAYFGILEFN